VFCQESLFDIASRLFKFRGGEFLVEFKMSTVSQSLSLALSHTLQVPILVPEAPVKSDKFVPVMFQIHSSVYLDK